MTISAENNEENNEPKQQKIELTDEQCKKILARAIARMKAMSGDWKSISEDFVELIDGRTDGRDYIRSRLPGLSLHSLNLFEKVGRGSLDPRLGPSAMIHKPHMLRNLSIADQLKTLDEKLSLAILGVDPGNFRLVRWSDELSLSQRKQLVSHSALRTVAEQILYLEALRTNRRLKSADKETADYFVKPNGVVVFTTKKEEHEWEPEDLLQLATNAVKRAREWDNKRKGKGTSKP